MTRYKSKDNASSPIYIIKISPRHPTNKFPIFKRGYAAVIQTTVRYLYAIKSKTKAIVKSEAIVIKERIQLKS
jgi:hypothetical protein